MTTITHNSMPAHASSVTVHQPAPFEKWLATQPAASATYQGRHRGRPAAEVNQQEVPAPAA